MNRNVAAGLGGFSSGSRIGGYLLHEVVGRGAMAVVFRARDERHSRDVALKILGPSVAADEGFRQRFMQESRATAAVDDPHIIPVYEAGEAAGTLFIAMRLVNGGDVGTLVTREGPLAGSQAAAIISPIAAALDAAHDKDLVHRDVKPSNMLLDVGSGRPAHVYLSDFGLARATAGSGGLTLTGLFLGTPDYASPEQIQGKRVDGRADQYALAASTFELLTGTPPFRRDEHLATIYAQVSQPPPAVSSIRTDLPPALDGVLGRALAKDPARRYASCQDFADAMRLALGLNIYDATPADAVPALRERGTGTLSPRAEGLGRVDAEQLGDGPPTVVAGGRQADDGRPPPSAERQSPHQTAPIPAGDLRPGRTRRRRRAVAAAVVAIAVVAGGIGGLTLRILSSHTRARVNGRSLTALPAMGAQDDIAFNGNGSYLASADRDGHSYIWRLKSGEPIYSGLYLYDNLPPLTLGVKAVAFSPNGQLLAAGDGNGDVYLWTWLNHGAYHNTLHDKNCAGLQGLAYNHNGTLLAVACGSGHIDLWNTARPRLTKTLLRDGNTPGITSVAVSPRGDLLAAGNQNGHVYVWDIITRRLVASPLASPASGVLTDVAFSSDGSTLATAAQNGIVYLWHVAQPGNHITALNQLVASASSRLTSVVFNEVGNLVAAGDADGSADIWSLPAGNLMTRPDPGGGGVNAVAFSPDGKLLAAGDNLGRVRTWRVGV